ncbi:unnamed protein product [Symbiodinium sp. CCMP2592]|nr:unnamed protein product [Symbiodinium sp. CCMP2592]
MNSNCRKTQLEPSARLSKAEGECIRREASVTEPTATTSHLERHKRKEKVSPEKGKGKPAKGKPAKGAEQSAKGKPAQTNRGAGQKVESPSSAESSLGTTAAASSGKSRQSVAPPASAKGGHRASEEAKPEASPKAAPKAAEAPAAKAKAPPPCLGPPPPLREAPEQLLDQISQAIFDISRDEPATGSAACAGPTPWSRPCAVANLRGLLESQAQQLQAAIGELAAQRQQQQGLAAAAATAAPALRPRRRAVEGTCSRACGSLPPLRGETTGSALPFRQSLCLAVVDTRYPAELEVARKCKVPLQMAAMTEEVRTMSVRLFGMLGSWTQDSATAVKLARGVKGQNGFELWRLLWQEHNPENESKNLTWRRTLLMPKFPPKESDFSLALQEWEADVDRYASEYGEGRALADEDLRAVLVTESPNALRQHLAMHAECWFKTKGKGKGNKGQVAQVADDAATTLSTASLATAGPSAPQAACGLPRLISSTAGPLAGLCQFPWRTKGTDTRLTPRLVEQFVDRLGYDKFTLQADQENAIASVARAVHRRLGAARVRLRDAPRGSHQSQGSVEGRNAHLAGEVRTWLSQLRADYPALEWDTSSNLFPWLARFGTKSTDGVTPYRAATGTDYGGALCSFGETVLAKLPRPGNKAQVRWVKGVWAGKLERDDSHEVERLEPPGEPMALQRRAAARRRGPPSGRGRTGQQTPKHHPTDKLANADVPHYEPSDVEAEPAAREGGQKRDSAGRTEPKKAPRLGALTEREVWQHIAALADPPLTNHQGERDAWVGQVTDLLDRMLDPKQVEQARKEQLTKLWDRGAFTPVLRSEVPRGAQLFRAKWVDKCDKGRHKSRCTCADVKARYSPEQEAGLDVFVPTPTPESHSLLEVAALRNEGWVTRSLDIVAAFLIGKDRGAAEGRPVYMHAPVEWRELFDQWVLEQPAKDQQWDELEEVLTGKLSQDYDFQRGVKDPCVFLDRRSGLILLHHIDDIRVAGPKAAVLKFTEVDLPKHCEITVGELEEPGTAVEVLGRTKVRTEDSILTLPDSKHAENVCEQLGIGPKDKGTVPSRPLDLTKVEELSAGDAARFHSAVGSAIYLSADRRNIQFAVKELGLRRRFGRVVVLDPASKSTALLNLEVYSDSDWAGCPETRSTDNIVACLGGAVIQTSCQTQPGLPATSSGDAEIRGVSRAAKEAVFLRELAEKDFALACGVPRLWADSAASIGAAKRIGPGSKLRHLEVAEFYVQGALRAKLLELRKVKGTENPANFATKHAKTGPEVRQSLPSMGMVDLDAVEGATEALAQKGTIKSIQASPWKMIPPTKLASSALMATIVALQVRPAKAQGHDFAELVLGFAALGFLAFLWMLWSFFSWLCRRRRERQEPEPEDEIEHHAERAEEPPRAAQRATEIWLGAEPCGSPAPAAPRVRHRRRGPEPLSGDDEQLYETARGDKIHLFTNCSGLSSVPPEQILIGYRCHCAADLQNSEYLWTGFAYQVATGRVVRRYHGQQQGCPFMEGATIRHRACLHCRNGHPSSKPGSAQNNSRRWVPPP